MVFLIGQTVVAIAIWFILGVPGLEATGVGRLAATATPFLSFPVIYVWKFLAAPSALARDAAEGHQLTADRIADLQAEINTLRARSAPSPYTPNISTDPLEPKHLLNIFEVQARLAEAWKRSPNASPDALDRPLYDRLRQGSVAAWGRPSSQYAPTMTEPWPLRKLIPKEFWENHVIEDLRYWMQEKRWMHSSQPRTVTMPLNGERNSQQCYWDLAFSEDDTEEFWPLPRSWMSA